MNKEDYFWSSMRGILLAILFGAITQHIPAQGMPSIIDSNLKDLRLKTIFIEPLSLIDQSFRFGTEHRLCGTWALVGTGGFYYNNARGWMVKSELKKYVGTNKGGVSTYFSLEYFYKQVVNHASDSITSMPGYRTDYVTNAYVTAGRIKYGAVTTLFHHLVIEWYAGAGLRYRNVLSTLTHDQYDHIYYNVDSELIKEEARYANAPAKAIRPDLTLGIRFGFRY